MRIETEIKGKFTSKNETEMVSFVAKKEDGRNWAAPLKLVSKGTGGDISVGLAVCLEISGDFIKSVQKNRHQPVKADSVPNTHPTVLPYGFVPIDIKHAVTDEPVWHDGSGNGDLLSGEILCELEALTPVLPGNVRYQAQNANQPDLQRWGFGEISPEKQIAEPLRLPDGRVVIAGSALKGMIRQSLGALTSAPMERVGERHFTYRPNLDFNKFGIKERYVVRPARVVAARDGGWDIEVFDDARRAVQFVRQGDNPPSQTTYRRVTYKGGIDGEGLLAEAFNPRSRTYPDAFVPQKAGLQLHLPAELYQRYLDDQRKVLSDDEIGHLTAHPNSKNFKVGVGEVAAAIRQHADFSPNQLIYVELTTDSQSRVTQQSKVVSCGHHFRYRWAYTSSIREQNGQLRACLTPLADERTAGKPERLTGARLLFGYVRDDKTNPVGKDVFERLAGRIAINHAVSDGTPRFLGDPARGYCIPLKILGQPKPSAWEFYLQQPTDSKNPLNTYGDLPGDSGGELAGRKFYRHQPSTKQSDITASDTDIINSDQATLARFVCDSGTRFRFSIRFARLRLWELGALLAVLEPHLLADGGKEDDYAHKLGLGRPLGMGSVRITRKAVRIRTEKEGAFLDDSAQDSLLKEALQVLQERLNDDQVQPWLSAHRIVKGQRLGYPLAETKVDGKRVQTIYAWHTNEVRRPYSQLRRQQSPDWSDLAGKIRSKR
ncbi:TIGR03986 family CRISPR-associated RAMP protein [Allochromatium tepidum]|uniref:DUF324 domain-containing protein n=1 Tax=Allochromatium tepidum TaxID=553982 RepID=A0ABM7QQV7_9GAMM|nr:TIGR03986 family CRISPR-associated RAMP protein [Allochromatium tepidum]BCU08294.1 hypothetical protein Atep_29710 [Allochromatium tepidum]